MATVMTKTGVATIISQSGPMGADREERLPLRLAALAIVGLSLALWLPLLLPVLICFGR